VRRSLEDSAETVAMNRQTLYVGFGGSKVAVYSDAPEVLAGLKRIFREMLESEPTRTVERLEVQRRDGKYNISGITEACIESGSLANTVERLRYEVVLRLIQARSDLIWLHAGAAAYRCSSVIILGPWGRGKSTLVTSLYAKGWTYLSDDVVPLDSNSGRAFPFPLTPMVREDPGEELPLERLSELRKTVMLLLPERVSRDPVPIRTVVFPVYRRGCHTELLPCSPATAALELLQNCLNFPSHREAAVRYICDLVRKVPAFRLSYSDGRLAAELIAQAHESCQQVKSSQQHHDAANAVLTSRSGAGLPQATKTRRTPSPFISIRV
jgi:hypothetical protein